MNHLKNIMIDILNQQYDEEHDVFLNLSSKYLPSIQQFLKFLDVLKSLELPLFDFFEIEARATHSGGCSRPNRQPNYQHLLFPAMEKSSD